MQQEALRPFACSYSPNVPELLNSLGCTLALSTYQAGKLIFLSAADQEKIIQLPRTFNKPMGIAVHPEKEKIALACKSDVHVFQNSKELAWHYPKSPGKYDSLYLPRMSYKTSYLDLHDLAFGKDNLYAVNTLFSCISTLSDEYNFTPYWKPKFITEIASEDRCHLNGMALENGKPKYVSCFNQGNTAQSWRQNITETGVIIDVDTDELVAEGLAMPHTPKLINGTLYVLMSATGELVKINTETGEKETILKLDSFVRGMDVCGEFLFIGLSKLRKNSKTFAHLMNNFSRNRAGVAIFHLPSGAFVGEIQYHTSVEEIYEVKVIPNTVRPNILNPESEDCNRAVSIPSTTFWASSNENN
jgi:uncharacterized protein (TIGR03032 family)